MSEIQKFEKVNEVLKKAVENGDIPGGSVSLIQNGEKVFSFEQGYADCENKKPIKEDTIFRLYSMTKPVTSVAVMQLVERGVIDLLEPVSKYLPGFANQTYYAGNEMKAVSFPMNIKNLMSMTSGLCYPGENNETEKQTKVIFDRLTEGLQKNSTYANYGTVQAMNDLGRIPLAFQPGERWNYSASADVLGAVVEVASGMPFSEYMKKNIFAPLEMVDTGFYVEEGKRERLAKTYTHSETGWKEYKGVHLAIQNRMDHPPVFESGGAGLCSTMGDYSNFMQMLLNQGAFNNQQILSPKTVEYITSGKLSAVQQPYMNWDSLEGYTYGNLMRVLECPGACGHLSTKGEYGWDGWLGAYMMNSPIEQLSFLVMYQVTDSGTTAVTRKLKNTMYSELSKLNLQK